MTTSGSDSGSGSRNPDPRNSSADENARAEKPNCLSNPCREGTRRTAYIVINDTASQVDVRWISDSPVGLHKRRYAAPGSVGGQSFQGMKVNLESVFSVELKSCGISQHHPAGCSEFPPATKPGRFAGQ